jgi:hypothetical protein
MSQHKKAQWAYLAGFIDAGGGYVTPEEVGVYHDDRLFMKHLIVSFGGSYRNFGGPDGDKHYHWKTEPGKHTEKTILALLPYTMVTTQALKDALLDVRTSLSPTTNTLSLEEGKIESDLCRDVQEVPAVMLER